MESGRMFARQSAKIRKKNTILNQQTGDTMEKKPNSKSIRRTIRIPHPLDKQIQKRQRKLNCGYSQCVKMLITSALMCEDEKKAGQPEKRSVANDAYEWIRGKERTRA